MLLASTVGSGASSRQPETSSRPLMTSAILFSFIVVTPPIVSIDSLRKLQQQRAAGPATQVGDCGDVSALDGGPLSALASQLRRQANQTGLVQRFRIGARWRQTGTGQWWNP